MNSIVLSVKTHYANLIIEGNKTLELRTSKIPSGRAFIYASGNTKKIIGHCSFKEHVEYIDPFNFYRCSCVSQDELAKYLNGRKLRVYTIVDAVKYPEPLDLVHFGLTKAPQSWAYARCVPATMLGGGF